MTDDNISTLIKQIKQELTYLRQDDIELTEQLTSFYDNLRHLRQSFALPSEVSSNSNLAPTSDRYYSTKPRSDSEPNILADRQRIVTTTDDLQ